MPFSSKENSGYSLIIDKHYEIFYARVSGARSCVQDRSTICRHAPDDVVYCSLCGAWRRYAANCELVAVEISGVHANSNDMRAMLTEVIRSRHAACGLLVGERNQKRVLEIGPVAPEQRELRCSKVTP